MLEVWASSERTWFCSLNSCSRCSACLSNTLNRLNVLEVEHERARTEHAEIDAQLKAVDAAGKGSSDRLMSILMTAAPGSPLEQRRNRIGDLSLKRQGLLVAFTEKHPQVEAVTQEMNALLMEARKDLQLLQQAATARESELSRRIDQINRENLKLPEKGLVLVRLQREVDLQQSLYSQLKAKYQEVLIQESGKVEEVAVVKPATEPAAPFNVPSKTMIVLTGIVMGLILGVVLVFLTELFDTSMGTIEDVEELLQVPVLGVIPQLGGEGKKKGRAERAAEAGPSRARDLVTHYDPKSQAAESFRALRTNLQFLRLELKGKLFLITSSFVQEGKTLNAVNLALSMAQAGHRVLLVDADLRKPSVHRVFGLGREPGVTDYVLGNYSWQEVVGTISDVMLGDFSIEDILRTPGMDNLHVLTAGTKPPNPTEILSSDRFRQFLAEARQSYDYVFVDAPPILPVADAAEISPLVDGVLLVYTVGRIGRGVLKRAKSNLDNVEAKVLGVVLNNVKPEAGPDYFRYHSHYYYGPDTPPDGRPLAAPEPASRRWTRPLAHASGALLVVLVLSAFTLGVFWQDMPELVPEWLLPYARTLFSN